MNREVCDIERVVRRMRGGSQAYLVQGSNGKFYVAKFMGNPQGTRTLINEWIAAQFLRAFSITTPELVVLRLNPSTTFNGRAPTFEIGNRELAIAPGLHLGSSCPVNPEKQAIYDYLPTHLINKTNNLVEFAKVLVLDTLLGQTDSRQAVFVRDRSRRHLSFRAHFIDHGLAFGGTKWIVDDLAGPGFYFDRKIYSMIDTASICEQTLASLAIVFEHGCHTFQRDLPNEWLESTDYDELYRLLAKLNDRRLRMRTLMSERLALLGLNGVRKSEQMPDPTIGVGALHRLSLDANLSNSRPQCLAGC